MENREESGKKEIDSPRTEEPKPEKTHMPRPKLVKRPPLIQALDQLADSLEAELKRLKHT